MNAALYFLFGRARSLVLETLHAAAQIDASQPLHLREIARRTGLSATAVHYEIRLLDQLGIVSDIGTEPRPLYVLDRNHEHFESLHAMFSATRKSMGDRLSAGDKAHFARKRIRQIADLRRRPEETSAFIARGRALRKSVRVD